MSDPKPKTKTCPRCYASCANTIKAVDELFGFRFKHTKDMKFSQSHCRECRRTQLTVVAKPAPSKTPASKMTRAQVQREYRKAFPKDKTGATKPTAELIKKLNSKQKAS